MELKLKTVTLRGGAHTGQNLVCGVTLPKRPRESHKGDYGRVGILGGCTRYSGAPVMAAQGAVRTGSGLVSVGVPEPVWPAAAVKLTGAMPFALPADPAGGFALQALRQARRELEGCDAALIGPGMGRGEGAEGLVLALMEELTVPLVLDADGLNALAGHIDVLDGRKGRLTVLTPHEGEFARLTGSAPGRDRVGYARAFAWRHGCILVLKGRRTVTALPDRRAFVNTSGNPGMARGGSGDLLAGMILSLLGQGVSPDRAVPAAVWLHGAAGDACARALGEYGMAVPDMIDALPGVLRAHTEPYRREQMGEGKGTFV